MHVKFRRAVDACTASLHEATIDDIDRVAGEVARALASLVADHQREVRRIQEDFSLRHAKTLAGAVVTAAALFTPALAPFTDVIAPAAPIALAGKYLADKREERLSMRRATRSLTGVLAAARRSADER
jgi:hypothetical protein